MSARGCDELISSCNMARRRRLVGSLNALCLDKLPGLPRKLQEGGQATARATTCPTHTGITFSYSQRSQSWALRDRESTVCNEKLLSRERAPSSSAEAGEPSERVSPRSG